MLATTLLHLPLTLASATTVERQIDLLGWTNLLVSTGLGFFLSRVSAATAKLNRAEDQRAAAEHELKEKVHELTTKLVDERFRDVTHKVRDHAQTLTSTMDKIALSLKETDRRIGAAELDLVKTTSAIRESLHDCAPSREEYEDLRATVRDLAKSVNETAQQSITQDQLVEALREARRER